MAIISKIAWKNTGVEVLDDIDVSSRYFWLNDKHIQTKIGHSNLPVVTNKYDPIFKKRRFELAEKLVKTFRADKIDEFRRSLGFNVIDVFNSKEQTVDAFE